MTELDSKDSSRTTPERGDGSWKTTRRSTVTAFRLASASSPHFITPPEHTPPRENRWRLAGDAWPAPDSLSLQGKKHT